MSKQQISNVFNSQEVLQSPRIAIEKYSGVRNGEIGAGFYYDCQNIPDPSALNPTQKNFCCWTTASTVNRIKPKRATLVVDTTIAIRYTLLKTTSVYPAIQFGRIRTLLSSSRKTRSISHTSMLTIVLVTYLSWNSNSLPQSME